VEELGRDRGVFYMTIGTIFIVALVMVLSGLVIIAHGATQNYRIDVFGLIMGSTSLGLACVGLGCLCLFLLYRNAMPKIRAILSAPVNRAGD
jgi:hypothetical protein